jgi:uncharacterized protein GlcG (DUF336 family)
MHPKILAIFVGGFPIEVLGEVVGGINISGGTGAQDKMVGQAALETFMRLSLHISSLTISRW